MCNSLKKIIKIALMLNLDDKWVKNLMNEKCAQNCFYFI